MAHLRVYLIFARQLWGVAIRWPLNPAGARLLWAVFLFGWRLRADLIRSARGETW